MAIIPIAIITIGRALLLLLGMLGGAVGIAFYCGGKFTARVMALAHCATPTETEPVAFAPNISTTTLWLLPVPACIWCGNGKFQL